MVHLEWNYGVKILKYQNYFCEVVLAQSASFSLLYPIMHCVLKHNVSLGVVLVEMRCARAPSNLRQKQLS